ncbi:MAG: hypothetical protein HY553_07695 [Elusimicrobia bacterium]|nr:hypothetical protein [Elusimicrobiota bacterium]
MGFFGKKAAAPVEESDPALDEPAPGGDDKRPEPANSKRKLWAALLVLDVVMIFIFGGTVAALLYMRPGAPTLAQAPARPPKAKKAEPPKEPPKEEPAKAEPANPAEAKAPEPKAPEAKPADRPTGSPAIHANALPKHSAEPITTAAKAEKAPPPPPKAEAKPKPAAPGGKTRAISVEFTHNAPSAKEVLLRAPFLVRTGGRQAMVKDSAGVWRLSLSLLPGTYRYTFMVDGKRTASETRLVE